MDRNDIQRVIETGKTALGVEFGPIRIKAVLIGEDHLTIASGSYDWKTVRKRRLDIPCLRSPLATLGLTPLTLSRSGVLREDGNLLKRRRSHHD